MYESGGEIHWTGHVLIVFGLMCVSVVATVMRWHQDLMALPCFMYLGYLLFKLILRAARFILGIFRR